MIIKSRKKDLAWSYLAYVLTLGINVILLPLVLKSLSSGELGLWYTFASVSTIISLVDFGFSPTIIRNLTYAWSGAKELKKSGMQTDNCDGNPNFSLFIRVFTCSKYLCLIISIIALLLLFTGGSFYILYVSREMSKNYLLVWLVYAIGCFANLYFNYWTNSLKSIGAIADSQKAIVTAKTVQFVVSVVGIYFGGGIMALSIAYLLSGIVQRLLSKRSLNKNNDIKKAFKKYNSTFTKNEILDTFEIIWYNAKLAGVSSLMSSVMMQSGTLICSGFLGVEITGSYGLGLQLVSILCSIGQIYFQTQIPTLTNTRITGNKEKEKKVFSASVMMFWITIFVGLIAICVVAIPLLRLLGSHTIPSISLILGIALYYIAESNYSIHATYISMGNRLPFVSSLVFTSILRVTLSIVLVLFTNLGIKSIIFAAVISDFMFIAWKWPYEALKELNISVLELIKVGSKVLLTNLKSLVIRNKLH